MAISAPISIGQATPDVASGATIALTTSVAVPSGGKIWMTVGWFGATTLSSVTGGGLTWTIDSTVTNGSNHEALVWADAPAGLPLSTVLTATFSAASTSRYAQAMYSTGVATGAATQRTSGTTGTTAWTSGALTVPNGSILIGACYGGSTNATNTASGGNTEVHDQSLATDSCTTTCYQMGTGASIAASGTWTASEVNAALGVQFDAAAVVAPAKSVLPKLFSILPLKFPYFPTPKISSPVTVAAPLNIDVLQAVETDIAQPIGRVKTFTLGQAIETDIAQPIVARKSRTVNQAIETDIAQPVGKAKSRAVNQAIETDIAQPIAKKKSRAVGQALETDIAQPVGKAKSRIVGQAIETDIAQPITRLTGQTINVLQAVETDVAQAIIPTKLRVVAQAVETDIAQPVGRIKLVHVLQVTELDIAQLVSRTKQLLVHQAVETDLALVIVPTKPGGAVARYPSMILVDGRIAIGLGGGYYTKI